MAHEAGYWPFRAAARPEDQTMAHCQLLDWVTTSGGQIAAFAHLEPGQIVVIGVPWEGHGGYTADSQRRYTQALSLFLEGKPPIVRPSK